LLVTAFLEKVSNPDEPNREMTENATRRPMAYDWPGTVRELENAIEGEGPERRSDNATPVVQDFHRSI